MSLKPTLLGIMLFGYSSHALRNGRAISHCSSLKLGMYKDNSATERCNATATGRLVDVSADEVGARLFYHKNLSPL